MKYIWEWEGTRGRQKGEKPDPIQYELLISPGRNASNDYEDEFTKGNFYFTIFQGALTLK